METVKQICSNKSEYPLTSSRPVPIQAPRCRKWKRFSALAEVPGNDKIPTAGWTFRHASGQIGLENSFIQCLACCGAQASCGELTDKMWDNTEH